MSLNNFEIIDSDGYRLNLELLTKSFSFFILFIPHNDILRNHKILTCLSDKFKLLCNHKIITTVVNCDYYSNNHKLRKKYNIPCLFLSDIKMDLATYYNCKIQKSVFGKSYNTICEKYIVIKDNNLIVFNSFNIDNILNCLFYD